MSRKSTFSDQLRRAIERSPMTRYRISQLTEVSEGNLSRFVNGKAGLSTKSIDRLCELLQLELRERRGK